MLAIIQARCSSKRFPNKVLTDIYGKPLIFHVISRVKKAKKIKNIIIATSKNKSDDKLVNYLKEIKVSFYRGDLNNVAQRLLKTAISRKQNFFLRVCADSPLIDPKIIDKAISLFRKNKKYQIVSNVFPRTFPKGQSVEIISTNILRKNLIRMNKTEKENVTPYFYKNSKNFRIKNFLNKRKNRILNTAIDKKKDLVKMMKKIKKSDFDKFKIY